MIYYSKKTYSRPFQNPRNSRMFSSVNDSQCTVNQNKNKLSESNLGHFHVSGSVSMHRLVIQVNTFDHARFHPDECCVIVVYRTRISYRTRMVHTVRVYSYGMTIRVWYSFLYHMSITTIILLLFTNDTSI